jgi:hypothetical protein
LAFFYVSVIKKVKRESIKAALAVDWTSTFGSSPSAEFVANGLCRLMLSKLKCGMMAFDLECCNGVKYKWIDSSLNQLMAEPDEWWSKQWIELTMYDQGDPSALMHATAREALMLQTYFQEPHFELSTIVTTCPLQTGQMPTYTISLKALGQPPKPKCPPEASAILLLMTQDLHLEGMLMPIVLPVLAKYESVFKIVMLALYSWLGLEAILLAGPMVIVVHWLAVIWYCGTLLGLVGYYWRSAWLDTNTTRGHAAVLTGMVCLFFAVKLWLVYFFQPHSAHHPDYQRTFVWGSWITINCILICILPQNHLDALEVGLHSFSRVRPLFIWHGFDESIHTGFEMAAAVSSVWCADNLGVFGRAVLVGSSSRRANTARTAHCQRQVRQPANLRCLVRRDRRGYSVHILDTSRLRGAGETGCYADCSMHMTTSEL